MVDKLAKLQQQERDALQAIKDAEAEAKKRLRAVADTRRKIQEQKWQALGQIVDEVGLGELPAEELRELLRKVAIQEGKLCKPATVVRDAHGQVVGAHIVTDDEEAAQSTSRPSGFATPLTRQG